jgi:putative DNA primase/helicase
VKMLFKKKAGRNSHGDTRYVAKPNGKHLRHEQEPEKARIIDAVKDQKDGYWIRYGTTRRSVWFSLEELHQSPSKVFSRMTGPGTTFLTPAAQNKFKESIEQRQEYRDALVAERSGWLQGHYVFADGTVQSPPDDNTEIVVSFHPDERFAPRGSLDDWQEVIGPLVEGQPLLQFALSYAFVGPLLRFAPPGFLNPQVEFVGRRECGKSTTLVAAQSVWGGNPDSDVGACETWDLTEAALDEIKLRHADGFLVLDEGNLAGSTSKQQRDTISASVFRTAGTGRKKRYGDVEPGSQARVAMMSTTNKSLAEHMCSQGAVAGALRSRMLTVRISDKSPYGVFASLPDGCSTSREAAELLQKGTSENFGTAARQFIECLAERASVDETAFRGRIEKLLTKYLERAPRGESARIGKTFALTAIAGLLACKWEVLPFDKNSVVRSILQMHRSMVDDGEAELGQSAIQRIQLYVMRHEQDLIDYLDVPLTPDDFRAAHGFRWTVAGREAVLIPSERFQREFPDYRTLMHELKTLGQAKTEVGKQPKLTIKCPTGICSTGRVYWIYLSPDLVDR